MSARIRLVRWPERAEEARAALPAGSATDESSPPAPDGQGGVRSTLPTIPDHLERARAIHGHRKERRRAFGADAAMFQEPAWDILLELYLTGTEGAGLASTSIAYATEVPITTTLRWIRSLEARGLVASLPDRDDARVRRVRLTEKAVQLMTRFLDRV